MAKKDDNFLDYIPRHNKNFPWEEQNGIVTVRQDNIGVMKWVTQKLWKKPKYSFIELDEFGSFVWKQMDGKKTVYEIGIAVRQQFGEKAEPLYERLSKYIKTLHEQRFVVYVGK